MAESEPALTIAGKGISAGTYRVEAVRLVDSGGVLVPTLELEPDRKANPKVGKTSPSAKIRAQIWERLGLFQTPFRYFSLNGKRVWIERSSKYGLFVSQVSTLSSSEVRTLLEAEYRPRDRPPDAVPGLKE